jgi:signal transduction histidine kinase
MSIGRKFILFSVVGVLALAGFGLLTVTNLRGLLRGAQSAAAEYEAMDRAQAVSGQVGWLRDSLRGVGGVNGQTYRDGRFFDPIRTEVTQIARLLDVATRLDEGDAARESKLAVLVVQQLGDAEKEAGNARSAPAAVASQLDLTLQTLGVITQLAPGAARRHVTAASSRLVSMLEWSIAWLLVVLAVSVLIHYRQYRVLVRPLVWLRDEMKTSAGREFQPLPEPAGGVDAEYRELAQHYNSLARELSGLYRDLEKKVVARSRELVRSERLASVGYLAAGVAHEINNPLSVISGYAELSIKSLRRMVEMEGGEFDEASARLEAETLVEALEAQRVILDESFRCKEITSRLLSLSRGGSNLRQPIALDDVARQVVTLTRGLRQFRDRSVSVAESSGGDLTVVANLTEIKQVLLNLTVNALEAVSPAGGEVRVKVSRAGEWIEVSVQDNGKGMSSEMLDQVFEPFFTAKRGAGEPGTGLGLSITHAIVEAHGGEIRAESAGPGLGSRFTVRLPAPNRGGQGIPERAAS